MTKKATGPRLLMMNTAISCFASGIAAYFNTTCIRQAEINNGIQVYSDPKLTKESAVGISQGAAKVAINETAYSRMALSVISISIPSVLILSL